MLLTLPVNQTAKKTSNITIGLVCLFLEHIFKLFHKSCLFIYMCYFQCRICAMPFIFTDSRSKWAYHFASIVPCPIFDWRCSPNLQDKNNLKNCYSTVQVHKIYNRVFTKHTVNYLIEGYEVLRHPLLCILPDHE